MCGGSCSNISRVRDTVAVRFRFNVRIKGKGRRMYDARAQQLFACMLNTTTRYRHKKKWKLKCPVNHIGIHW